MLEDKEAEIARAEAVFRESMLADCRVLLARYSQPA